MASVVSMGGGKESVGLSFSQQQKNGSSCLLFGRQESVSIGTRKSAHFLLGGGTQGVVRLRLIM